MVIYLYRWRVPGELRAAFRQDWLEVTNTAKTEYGLIGAYLTEYEDGSLLSFTFWPKDENRIRFAEELACNSARKKYRIYRISDPERLEILESI